MNSAFVGITYTSQPQRLRMPSDALGSLRTVFRDR